MGNATGKACKKVYGKRPIRMLLMGLHDAGKTTVVYKLNLEDLDSDNIFHYIGADFKKITHNDMDIQAFDFGGRERSRSLLRMSYARFDAAAFVVDSTNRDVIDDVRQEIHRTVDEAKPPHAPILVLANKQDLDNAMSTAMITEKLELHKLRNIQWHIVGASGKTGEGLSEGMDWLTQQISYNQAAKDIKESATKVVGDNKTIITGWRYALHGLHNMKQCIWKNSSTTTTN